MDALLLEANGHSKPGESGSDDRDAVVAAHGYSW
jgi:hypothetical protein